MQNGCRGTKKLGLQDETVNKLLFWIPPGGDGRKLILLEGRKTQASASHRGPAMGGLSRQAQL